MNNVYVKHTVAFILLYVAQIFLLDKVALWGFVTPMIYILFILSLPFDTPNWLMVVLGFVAGLIMDSFTGSLGMHALSLMTIAFLRKWVITVIPFYGEKEPHLQPKLYDMKFVWYLQYAFLLTLIHHAIYYFVDAMSLKHFGHTLWVILVNTLFTVIAIFIVQAIFYKPSKRY